MATLNLSVSGEEDSQLEQDGSPLASGQEEMASNLRVVVDISSSSRRSVSWHFLGGWYLDVEKPICHLPLLPILLNCVRSHVDLLSCVRSVRAIVVVLTDSKEALHLLPASHFLVRPSIASPTYSTLLSGEYRCWSFLDYVEDIYLAGRLLRSFQKNPFTLCTSFHNLHNLS